LELEVKRVKIYAHAFVVWSALYWLLLGRSWQKGVKLEKIKRENGSMEIEISDPGKGRKRVVVPTRKRIEERLQSRMLVLKSKERKKRVIQEGDNSLTEAILLSSFTYNVS